MVACLTDIKNSVEVGRLSAGCQHGGHTTFEGGYLGGNGVVRRVLQAGVEVAVLFKVEKACHLLAGFILEGCTLVDGEHAGFTLLWSPSGLYAECLRF